MSDTKWWRLKDWILDLLEDEPMDVHEIGELLDRDSDKIYVGMILYDLINKGEVKWDARRTFTLVTKPRGMNNGCKLYA